VNTASTDLLIGYVLSPLNHLYSGSVPTPRLADASRTMVRPTSTSSGPVIMTVGVSSSILGTSCANTVSGIARKRSAAGMERFIRREEEV